MTTVRYRHVQTGWVMIALMMPALIFLILACMFQWGSHPMPFAVCWSLVGLLGFICLLFYRLDVSVDKQGMHLRYGIGLIHIRLPIDQLLKAEVIRTPWYYGLGIRLTPKGMLYNIHGTRAVHLQYRIKGKEKHVMIGSDEPERLKKVLEDQFGT